MKISLDGGALCAPPNAQYGTYRFSTEIIEALKKYSKYSYNVYAFCTIPPTSEYKTNITYKKLIPPTAWMQLRIPLEETLHPSDIFLGLNQALPKGVKAKKVAFSHGLSFVKFPDAYPKDYKRLKQQLDSYIKNADAIVVSSRDLKKDMIEYAEESRDKITILPFGLPQAYAETAVLKVHKEPFFLYVGSDQPIKNVEHILKVFTRFRKETEFSDFQLRLVGTNLEDLPTGVSQISHASLEQLQQLYSSASAYIAVSRYESFNYPVIEALSLGCPVIGYKSAIIHEQRTFCHIADDEEELLDFMKFAAGGSMPHIDRKMLLQRFSWESYVKSLEKLYLKI